MVINGVGIDIVVNSCEVVCNRLSSTEWLASVLGGVHLRWFGSNAVESLRRSSRRFAGVVAVVAGTSAAHTFTDQRPCAGQAKRSWIYTRSLSPESNRHDWPSPFWSCLCPYSDFSSIAWQHSSTAKTKCIRELSNNKKMARSLHYVFRSTASEGSLETTDPMRADAVKTVPACGGSLIARFHGRSEFRCSFCLDP